MGQLASAAVLTELILQDNHLTAIPDLSALVALQRLEVSYNLIKSLAPLTSLKSASLSALYAASNRISSVRACIVPYDPGGGPQEGSSISHMLQRYHIRAH